MRHYRLQKFKGVKYLNNFELSVFLAMILYRAGDVEKNPGPVNDNTSDTSSSTPFPVFNGNFSVKHCNVQSVQHKLEPEFANFSLVSLTETWLNESIINQALKLNNQQFLFRRDSHGGILVYVKDGIPCKRRTDLELINIDCVEVNVRNKRVLVGTFHRPPNSLPLILSDIENSIGLAVDTGI